MNVPVGNNHVARIANPARFNSTGKMLCRYYALCPTCDPDICYYQTPPLADQGPLFQAYCNCGALRTFRRLP